MGIVPPPHLKLGNASASFQHALAETGFVDPALAITYVTSTSALCFDRTAPLGVVLLAPIRVIIFLTDTLLDHSVGVGYIAWRRSRCARLALSLSVPANEE